MIPFKINLGLIIFEHDRINLAAKLIHFSFSFLTGNPSRSFSYGYSSFKGKRTSMEDYYETRISEVDGQMVAFFGVFDGNSQPFNSLTLFN